MSELGKVKKPKRKLPTSFDLNVSTVPIQRKYWRTRAGTRMANANENNEPRFWDMSASINATNQQNETARASVVPPPHTDQETCEELDPAICQIVNQSVAGVQQNLNIMVKESVAKEMERVFTMIAQINEKLGIQATGTNLGSETSSTASSVNSQPVVNTQIPNPQNPIQVSAPNIPGVAPTSQSLHTMMGWPQAQAMVKSGRVEKFGVVFDGNQNKLSVDDFVFRVEHLQWSNQIPWNEVLRDFHLLVSGEAHEWYWLQVKGGKVPNWESLKQALFSRYKTPKSYLEATRNLIDRKQQPGESVDSFFHSFNLLCSRLEQPISEFELIKIAKSNVKESLGRLVFPMFVSTLEQLRIACIEAERNFYKRENRYVAPQPTRISRQVSETTIERENNREEEEDISVAAISSQITCWNCKKVGHMFIDCTSTERNIFCYRCGKPDTITPYCSNCKSGNGKRNMAKAGNHRPLENPAILNQSPLKQNP